MAVNNSTASVQRVIHLSLVLTILLGLFSITPTSRSVRAAGENPPADGSPTQPQAPDSPLTTPETILTTSGVSDFFRVGTVMYWHAFGSCYTPPNAPTQAPILADVNESTHRLSLTGASAQRTMFLKDLRATNSCSPYVFSRVVADSDFVYWVDATGLVKLSKDANQGETPQVVSAFFNDQLPYEIAISGNYIYLSRAGTTCTGICIIKTPIMEKVDKTTGAYTGLNCFLGTCPYGHNLKVDPYGRYLYYLTASNSLYRQDVTNGSLAPTLLANNVTAYYPEGQLLVSLIGPTYTDKVFFAQSIHIYSHENSSGTNSVIYTSNSIQPVSINDLISDKGSIFFYEVRRDICISCLVYPYTGWLFRSGRTSNTSTNIYQTTSEITRAADQTIGLDTDNVKLYWTEGTTLYRLSDQATALPKYPMSVTGIEIVQSVQTLANTVPLIQGKRTFVRVYAHSTDATHDVSGVTARLQATWTGLITASGWTDWVEPTNISSITIKRNPQRIHLNEGFLFELPWDWVSHSNLRIRAELNPNHNPEESDGYANNVLATGLITMNPSPRLEVRIFDYSYSMGGKVLSPDPTEDQGNIDWIANAYPVSGSSYGFYGTTTGLVWENFPVRDDALADLVRYPTLPCEDKDTTAYPNDAIADCENLRASEYVNSQISGMRDGLENAYHDTDNTSYYGLIPGGSELRGYPAKTESYFPRGLDTSKNASGPAGAKFLGFYAGHEIGHSLGLGHPGTAGSAKECGIEGSDSYPTYAHAHIGTTDDTTTVMGFKAVPKSTYPRYDDDNLYLGSITFDMMAYCRSQWISDQNYLRIFASLAGYVPLAPQAPRTAGDWLSVYGGIYPSKNTATIDYLEHKTADILIPAITPGAYTIRLLNIGGGQLANYAFSPSSAEDAPVLMYGQVVAFAAGTRKVQIIRNADQAVLVEKSISANKPSISGVTVGNPALSPVTLSWTASHPDSLPLTFNIYYSPDGGTSWQPYMLHVAATSQLVDTIVLAGSASAKFRVVASDGANTNFADSATFSLPSKSPKAHISLPAADLKVRWGQLVNFSGSGIDLQDGELANLKLHWTSHSTFADIDLGTGKQISVSDLPMGANTITLTVTNSSNQTGTAAILVTVTDDIEPDGPTMQVAPGSITFNIASGVTAVQSALANVVNFGTGGVSWQVTSDRTWLTTSAASGTAPTDVTVYANPSEMVNGETRSGTLTFTTSSSGSLQTIQIPVTIVMGDIFQSPYFPAISTLYLPLLRK